MAELRMGRVVMATALKPPALIDGELRIIFEQSNQLNDYRFTLSAEDRRTIANLRDDLTELLDGPFERKP